MTSFGSITKIDNRTKLIVNGYIRLETKYHIPSLIIHIIIWYFWMNERFSICGSTMKINCDGDIVRATKALRNTAYGTVFIDMNIPLICLWRIKILKYQYEKYSQYHIFIGISSTNREYLNYGYQQSRYNHGSYNTMGCIQKKGMAKPRTFGQSFKENDIISMELNTMNKTLKFYKNDKSQGIAFTNIPTKYKYYLAVSFCGYCQNRRQHAKILKALHINDQNAVQIIDFKQTSIK